MNTMHLIGHAGKDAELKYTPQGTPVCKVSVADSLPAKPGEERETIWYTVILWGKLAETAAKFIKKGTQVYCEGRLHPRTYLTKDGKQAVAYELIAQTYLLLGPRPAADKTAQGDQGDAGDNTPFPF